jgi:hypothetical protein
MLVLGPGGTAASSADLIVKAPPAAAAPAPTLDVHGWFDVMLLSDYMTPRGNLLNNTGLVTQVNAGLSLDLYKNKTGLINKISVFGGVWEDYWSTSSSIGLRSGLSAANGPWYEGDWYAGVSWTMDQRWNFSETVEQFRSPNGWWNTITNIESKIEYNDSDSGLPIAFHPYVNLFYSASGSSTVTVGKNGNTYDVEIGMVPTLDLKKYTGVPLTLKAPTWVTVGPASFWNANIATKGGGFPSLVGYSSNFGVASTGLTGVWPLDFIPANLGKWYGKAGFQYYHLINNDLLAAQVVDLSNTPTLASAKRDVVVAFTGFGASF